MYLLPGHPVPNHVVRPLPPASYDQGRPRAVFRFTVSDGKIAGIDVVVDPERARGLEVVVPAE